VTKSFRAALIAYPREKDVNGSLPHLSSADVAHLKRWADDERADEVWKAIESAAKKRGMLIPPRYLIQEVLGARDLVATIRHRRKYRERYRKHAARMVEVAKILREPLPNGLMLMPSGADLADRLDQAAQTYRDFVAAARNETEGLTSTRQSKSIHVFMGFLSKDLKEITGKWLDYEVAVLSEIAFDKPEIDSDQVIWARRRVKRDRRASKRTK
jgi:hypothetical protein